MFSDILLKESRVYLHSYIPRGCHGPPRDRTPPKLSCPPDIERFADPIQYYTHVSWIEPSAAYDDHDGKLMYILTRSGPPPGRLFSEGNTPTRIGYYARDRSGNMARCSFSINVRVTYCSRYIALLYNRPLKYPSRNFDAPIRCPNLHDVSDGYYVCHPSDDMLLGTICRFGCYHGHDLVGPHAMKCIRSVDDGIWNVAKQPYCQKSVSKYIFY
ncbi:hypothetical protein KUTeg_018505 [Tegillarca granosa]|uniref:Sushi domain-containing protein n=1 Tax=Tegillarca granosa TaxID=220873 RepID=A0ABQ9ELX1_TEGGR|nr:hypothetical protein KUTeg_018505 [Tegillarca granosa]